MRVRRYGVLAMMALAGCAQFTTSDSERADLEAASKKAGDAYVGCVVGTADRYVQTGENADTIIDVAKRDCAEQRKAFEAADTTYVNSLYMQTEAPVAKHVAALDTQATEMINERVLKRKAALPPPAVVPAVAVAVAAPVAGGEGYLDCMRAQGQRYAAVSEPAEVVAEVAHSRCAGSITDPATAAQLERQGRAMVMGMVLDKKAAP